MSTAIIIGLGFPSVCALQLQQVPTRQEHVTGIRGISLEQSEKTTTEEIREWMRENSATTFGLQLMWA